MSTQLEQLHERCATLQQALIDMISAVLDLQPFPVFSPEVEHLMYVTGYAMTLVMDDHERREFLTDLQRDNAGTVALEEAMRLVQDDVPPLEQGASEATAGGCSQHPPA